MLREFTKSNISFTFLTKEVNFKKVLLSQTSFITIMQH